MASPSDRHHAERPKPYEDENQPKPSPPPDGNHSSGSPPPPSTRQQDTAPNNYPHQPLPGYPPPVMGYPPPYPPPHGGGGGGGGYPYGTPPPHVGYYPTNNPNYYPSQVPPQRTSGFARGILAALIFLVVASCTISVIMYIVLRPQIPEFHVTAFSVTNFNISNSVPMGSWDANVTVDNKNQKLKAYFERIQSYVYYDDPRTFLSWSTEPAFSLERKTSGVIHAQMTTIDGEQPSSVALEEMDEERRKGTVVFGLGLGLMGTFKSGWWWTSHFGMRIYCDGLDVGFVGASGTGSLRGGNPRQCVVYV
ncbi:hypothetical protein ACJRO7_002589 [Eucalyptus globulus]|uniref:Late embryogenesis abundant protein LEA-2 subgroup domain-containing protein n=1 Tax=Eucalyptus globulus TaxID=34317 RepID=A0ABD3LUW9_EUCGL